MTARGLAMTEAAISDWSAWERRVVILCDTACQLVGPIRGKIEGSDDPHEQADAGRS
jgi:hypothetical protein